RPRAKAAPGPAPATSSSRMYYAMTSSFPLAVRREEGGDLARVSVRVVGLIGREVAGIDLPPGAVRARARGRAGPLEQLDDLCVGGREAFGELHGFAVVVPALQLQRVLVVRASAAARRGLAPPHTVPHGRGR